MKATLLVLLAAAISTAACSKQPDALPDNEAATLIENRNWLDRWPTHENDRLYVYRFTPQMGGGVYQDRTLFAGRFELFNYELEPGTVEIRWPDRQTVERVPYTITAVSGPKPFDLKLSLQGTTVGPKVFYGMRNEGAHTDQSPWWAELSKP